MIQARDRGIERDATKKHQRTGTAWPARCER
jgi:hypothetical protein